MARQLEDKVVLITGAAAGMGREDAILMARRGASIIAHDLQEEKLAETAELVREAGGRVETFACDLTDAEAFAAGAAAAEKAFGRIDVLVNNAGIHGAKPVEEVTVEDFDTMFAVNLTGLFTCTKAVVPGMKARKSGVIVNISSGAAQRGNVNNSVYGASKAGVLGLTKAWAKELAPWSIRVNAVSPGPIATEMTVRNRGWEGIRERAEKEIPLRRYGLPEDVSYAVAYLAGDGAGFVTGQVITLAGGLAIVGI
jgi:NAD(P)-dependent dehydrogenase (short-subunit alcohol dehydrogenase family)